MTTLNITNNLKAEINIINSFVSITTYMGSFKRTSSYLSIEEAINNCTIKPVVNFLNSL
jgi:hypothetical protein